MNKLVILFAGALIASSESVCADDTSSFAFGGGSGHTQNRLRLTTSSGLVSDMPVMRGSDYYEEQGWYRGDGWYMQNNPVAIAGYVDPARSVNGGYYFNNFFAFDLSAVSQEITEASLSLYTWDVVGENTYSLFDVDTPASILLNAHSANNQQGIDIYNDLGSGAGYGNIGLVPTQSYTVISITLSGRAIMDINATRGGIFAIGGTMNPLPVSSVPEPESYAMFLAGLGLIGFAAKRRRAS